MKAKNTKQAIESGNYRVRNILNYGEKVRIDFQPRYPHSEWTSCSFWVNEKYAKRNYTNIF